MRLERIQFGSITVIHDAYNANPGSIAAGLSALADMPTADGGRRVAVLADMLELGEMARDLHVEAGERLARLGRIDCLIAVGPNARYLADAAQAAAPDLAIERFADSREAAAAVDRLLRPGDTVLLKGSRGMQMERLLGPIENLSGQ